MFSEEINKRKLKGLFYFYVYIVCDEKIARDEMYGKDSVKFGLLYIG